MTRHNWKQSHPNSAWRKIVEKCEKEGVKPLDLLNKRLKEEGITTT